MRTLTFAEHLSLAFHLRTAAEVYRADAIKVASHAGELPTTKQLAQSFTNQAEECDRWADLFEQAANSTR